MTRTEQSPRYWKVPHKTLGVGTQLYMVTVDEGWRETILCTGMYEWAADWLVEQLQGRPFAPEGRP